MAKRKSMTFEKPKPIKITVERDEDDKLELTINWDADLYKWAEVFKIILKWLSFTDDSIDELFKNEEDNED